VSVRLPVISGMQLIDALGKLGWGLVRQRGSRVRLKKPDHSISLVVPLHRELKRGTLGRHPATQASTATSSASCCKRLTPT
jgi:predicted RNA binding protein YcfA (HicA-like mRNA interferase family)